VEVGVARGGVSWARGDRTVASDDGAHEGRRQWRKLSYPGSLAVGLGSGSIGIIEDESVVLPTGLVGNKGLRWWRSMVG
jgi:hypothetical protein